MLELLELDVTVVLSPGNTGNTHQEKLELCPLLGILLLVDVGVVFLPGNTQLVGNSSSGDVGVMSPANVCCSAYFCRLITDLLDLIDL